MGGAELVIALSAGVASFIAPCVLPLIPVFLVVLAAQGNAQAAEGEGERVAGRLILFTLVFIAAFIAVFAATAAVAGGLSSAAIANLALIERIAGVILLALGLSLILTLKWLQPFTESALAPLLLGGLFGAVWTPCVGPVLGAILTLAADDQTLVRGISLLAAYGLGLTLPFLALASAIAAFDGALAWLSRHGRPISIVGGAVAAIMGVLLIVGAYSLISSYLLGLAIALGLGV